MATQGDVRADGGHLEANLAISGQHLCVDLHDCEPGLLDEMEFVQDLLIRAAVAAGARVLNVTSHQFEPRGVTIVLLLAESHLALHSWPEHRFAAMDIFTCGPSMRPEAAAEVVIAGLGARSERRTVITRGMPMPSGQR